MGSGGQPWEGWLRALRVRPGRVAPPFCARFPPRQALPKRWPRFLVFRRYWAALGQRFGGLALEPCFLLGKSWKSVGNLWNLKKYRCLAVRVAGTLQLIYVYRLQLYGRGHQLKAAGLTIWSLPRSDARTSTTSALWTAIRGTGSCTYFLGVRGGQFTLLPLQLIRLKLKCGEAIP